MNFLARFYYRLTGWVPRSLPTGGVTEFLAFANRIIYAYGLPDYDSYREAIAQMILHMGPDKRGVQRTRVAPSLLAGAVRKAMANEVAYSYLQNQVKARKEQEQANGKNAANDSEVGGDAGPGSDEPSAGVSAGETEPNLGS